MSAKAGLLTSKWVLVGALAVGVSLVFLVFNNRQSPGSPIPGSSAIIGEPADSPANHATQPGEASLQNTASVSAGSSDPMVEKVTGESVNPTIDRYGVPVSVSLPIEPVSKRGSPPPAGAPGSGIPQPRTMQAPESGIAQDSYGADPGPGPLGTANVGAPPEGTNPQLSVQAPEASDPGLPMLPPESTDAGMSGPGPGELDSGVPTTPPDAQ